jgi:tetratricopeptide (TPR) repeat protein
MFAATFHIMGGEMGVEELVEHTRVAAELAERQGDAFSRSWTRFWDAYALFESGNARAALDGYNRALVEIHERRSGLESESMIHRGIGTALVALGRVDEGIEAGRRAVTLAEQQSVWLSALWSRESLAGWLLDRAELGDAEEAAEHLRAAGDLAETFGHVIYMERVAALRDRFPTTA